MTAFILRSEEVHGFRSLEHRRVFVATNSADFLSHQAGEKIRYSKFAPGRAVGLSFIVIGWLGYSLLAFFIFINFVAPLAAWAWAAFIK